MRLYIAGPMSGLPDHGFAAFREAAFVLRKAGHNAISPVELDEADGFDEDRAPSVAVGSPEYNEFLRRDLAIVSDPETDAVVVLAGWENSHGAQLEVHVARALGKQVLSYPELTSLRHPSSERFHSILHSLGALHDRKQQDYGRGDDPFANVRGSAEWGIEEWVGAMIRATDKVRRLQTFASRGTLANEGVVDAFDDLAVYAIIGRVLFEESQAHGSANEWEGSDRIGGRGSG